MDSEWLPERVCNFIELLYAHPAMVRSRVGTKNIVGLGELGLEQAIKRIVDVDFKWAAFLRAAQPCCLRAATNAFNARVTIRSHGQPLLSRNPEAVPPCKEQSRASGGIRTREGWKIRRLEETKRVYLVSMRANPWTNRCNWTAGHMLQGSTQLTYLPLRSLTP